MNNINKITFDKAKQTIEELEHSSVKLVIDDKIVYILDMQYLSNGGLDVQYICFHRESEYPDFTQKVQQAVQNLIQTEIQKEKDKKWYRILFSRISALIKNIRKRFGRS